MIDLSGERFGRLVVLEHVRARNKSGAFWRCRCDCGMMTDVSSSCLRSGHTKSCGCLRADSKPNLKHGRAHPCEGTYKTWKEMRQRCNNRNDDKYKWYGARGISVCDRWNDFSLFLSDMGERPEGMSIDRIDNNGNYEPDNCRWATPKMQGRNSRWAKLDKCKVKLIKEMHSSGIPYSKIGDKFGVSASAAQRACVGITWG